MTVSFAQVEAATREVIAEHPDFVYREFRAKQLGKPVTERRKVLYAADQFACVYYDEDGEKSCLFGFVLDKLGLEIEKDHTDGIVSILQEEFGVDISATQADWLGTLQEEQDKSLKTWSDILEEVDEYYPLYG